MVSGWGRENQWEKLRGGRRLGVCFSIDGFGGRSVCFFGESPQGEESSGFFKWRVDGQFQEKNKSKKMGAVAALEKIKASGLLVSLSLVCRRS